MPSWHTGRVNAPAGVTARAAHACVLAWRWVRGAPGTYVWLAILAVTSTAQHLGSDRQVRHWLQVRSTNLHHLADDPIHVLLTSALWTDGGGWLGYAVLFTVFHATAERWLGTLRWLAVALSAHVGATYLSQGVLLWAIRHDYAPERAAFTLDVGVSYALAGVIAVLAYHVAPPWRWLYLAGVAAVYVPPVLITPTFTDVGHCSAALIGLACLPLTRGRGAPVDPGALLRGARRRLRGTSSIG